MMMRMSFILISVVFFLEGCSALDDFVDCSGASGNYEKDVNANTYYYFKKHKFEKNIYKYDKNKKEYKKKKI